MKRKPIAPLVKHQHHQVEIQPSTAHNYAKYYCRDCNKFIAWLSKYEVQRAQELNMIQK